MELSNGTKLEIVKSWYNKTKVQEDGVNYYVEPTQHPMYQFDLYKNYFDIEDKEEVVKAIIDDLKDTIRQLEGVLERDEVKHVEVKPPENDYR